MGKPGSWFLLVKLVKNTCGGMTFQDAGHRQVFFARCLCKNQLPGFCTSGTLVENGLP